MAEHTPGRYEVWEGLLEAAKAVLLDDEEHGNLWSDQRDLVLAALRTAVAKVEGRS